MTSLYLERRSWLHTVPPLLKLLVLAASTTLLMAVNRPAVQFSALAAAVILTLSLRPLPPGMRRLLHSMILAAFLLAVLQACMGHPTLGLASAARLLAVSLLGMSVTATTSYTQFLDLFESLLSPLGGRGSRTRGWSLQLALTIRFTAHFHASWQRLADAYRVRTGRSGGWMLIAPLAIQMLLSAHRVSDALQVRLGALD